jgi:nitrite reductase/ring-hydroxylating ferredoxin subunit
MAMESNPASTKGPRQVVVGPTAEHPEGDVRTYDLSERSVAVCWTDEGWYAVDDECTHQRCSLGQGDLVGTTLTCPCHLGVYDVRTGEVLEGPPPAPLRTYPVDASDGVITIELSTEDR